MATADPALDLHRDERVRQVSLAAPPPAAAGAGGHGRHDPGLRLLRRRGRRQGHVHGQGDHQLPRGLGPARDHRHGRRPPDDRRRVRPLGGLDDRLCRHLHRHPGDPVGLAGLDLHPVRLRRRGRGWLDQRLPRGGDRPALLHRHPGRPLHPARAHHRHHPRHDRPHPDPRHGPALAGRSAGPVVRRRRLSRACSPGRALMGWWRSCPTGRLP